MLAFYLHTSFPLLEYCTSIWPKTPQLKLYPYPPPLQFPRATLALHLSILNSSPFTDDLNHAGFHRNGIETTLQRAPYHLIQQHTAQALVTYKAPQVKLQVLAVHLNLLQTIPSESAQTNTFQERLQTDLYYACKHRHLRAKGEMEGMVNHGENVR